MSIQLKIKAAHLGGPPPAVRHPQLISTFSAVIEERASVELVFTERGSIFSSEQGLVEYSGRKLFD